jgi:hypothetical protein
MPDPNGRREKRRRERRRAGGQDRMIIFGCRRRRFRIYPESVGANLKRRVRPDSCKLTGDCFRRHT